MRFWGILTLFSLFSGAYVQANGVCEEICKKRDEATEIANELFNSSHAGSNKCVIENNEFERNPAFGARIVKFRLTRSCAANAPISSDKQNEFDDPAGFERLIYEAAGIQFKHECFTKHALVENGKFNLQAGDTLQFRKETMYVDFVGKQPSHANDKIKCDDLIADPSHVNLGVIFYTMDAGGKSIVRQTISTATGGPSANNFWTTQVLMAAQKACERKMGSPSEITVNRFDPNKPGCLHDVYKPFREDGGACAKCCLVHGSEVGP